MGRYRAAALVYIANLRYSYLVFAMAGDAGRPRRRRPIDRLRERLADGPIDEPSPLFTHIADQITSRRTELRLSQVELAQLCDTTQSAIARSESGDRPPRIDTLQRLAAALDCELVVELRPRTRKKRSTS